MSAIIKGSSRLPEVNSGIGRLWLDMARERIALVLARVESKANVADGPTRDVFDYLDRLDAKYIEPLLPTWCKDLWSIPSDSE